MRLTVLGAGAIGPASAALAASRGHDVTIWSPSGRGTAGIERGLHCEGQLTGHFALRIAGDLAEALRDADAALLAVPGYAFPALLPLIAQAASRELPLFIAPASALAPLAFDALRAGLGPRAPVGALATTPVTARRLAPDRVRIPAIRAAIDVAALPAAAAPGVAAIATALFGHACPCAPNVLLPALANANPIMHAVMALLNTTRIERAEDWPQYEMITEASGHLMLALQGERDLLAAAFGLDVPPLAEALHRASGVKLGPLHEMAQGIVATGRTVAGPTSMQTRYVTEDVPYGLSFYLWLAARTGIALPHTEAMVLLLESIWQRDLRDNAMLAAIGDGDLGVMLREGIGRAG